MLFSSLISSEGTTPPAPAVLVLGHSFVRWIARDLESNFNPRTPESFNLRGDVRVHLHGISGRTVKQLIQLDLVVISASASDAVILEIGTNDLSLNRPELPSKQTSGKPTHSVASTSTKGKRHKITL